jgi:hypothetical protein
VRQMPRSEISEKTAKWIPAFAGMTSKIHNPSNNAVVR